MGGRQSERLHAIEDGPQLRGANRARGQLVDQRVAAVHIHGLERGDRGLADLAGAVVQRLCACVRVRRNRQKVGEAMLGRSDGRAETTISGGT